MVRLPRALAAAVPIALAVGCGDEAYIELQIADDRLPFLVADMDFDALGVSARADGCADTEVRYPAQTLPATLTVLRGDCFRGALSIQAFALRTERRVAESSWLDFVFPSSGVLVATATLTELPGPRVRFRTGFEPGDPIDTYTLPARDVDDLDARVDDKVADKGARSMQLRGLATSTSAYVVMRVAPADLVIAAGDRLIYTMRIEPDSSSLSAGIDLQLDSRETAETLGLEDVSGIPAHPASSVGRVADNWQRFVVDLTPAAGARLVGVLFGFDFRGGGTPGLFEAHLDDVQVEAP